VRDDNAISSTADGTVTLANNDTSYVEVDPATGAVSDNITGFTAGSIPLAEVTTAAGAITAVTDKRTWAGNGPAGAPGGVSDFTDLGDVPAAYDEAYHILRVNSGVNALEFAAHIYAQDDGFEFYDDATGAVKLAEIGVGGGFAVYDDNGDNAVSWNKTSNHWEFWDPTGAAPRVTWDQSSDFWNWGGQGGVYFDGNGTDGLVFEFNEAAGFTDLNVYDGANYIPGITQQVQILDGDTVTTHTLTFTLGILTGYST
jgi:hypothetical protein